MKKFIFIFFITGVLFAQTNQSTIKRTGWINDTTRAVVSDSLAKSVLKTDSTNTFATPTQVKGLIGDTSAVLQAQITDMDTSKIALDDFGITVYDSTIYSFFGGKKIRHYYYKYWGTDIGDTIGVVGDTTHIIGGRYNYHYDKSYFEGDVFFDYPTVSNQLFTFNDDVHFVSPISYGLAIGIYTWNSLDSLGQYSMSIGGNTKAKGGRSLAVGTASEANGSNSFALGGLSISSGANSSSMGEEIYNSGQSALVTGADQYNTSPFSLVTGLNDTVTNATGFNYVFGKSNIIEGDYNWIFGQYIYSTSRGLWLFGSDNSFTKKRVPYHDRIVFWNEPLTISISDPVTANNLPSRSSVSFQVFDTSDSTEYQWAIQKPTGQTYSDFGLWAHNDFSANGSGGLSAAVTRRVFNINNTNGRYDLHFNDYKTDGYDWGNFYLDNGKMILGDYLYWPGLDSLFNKYTNTLDNITTGSTNVHLTSTLKSNYDAAYSHISLTNNPHSVTATQVGLGNLTNKLQVEREDTTDGTAGNYMTWKRTNDYFFRLSGGILTGNILMTSNKIIGGSATTSDLFLQTTSGVGATGADMHFLVGNNGATEAVTVLNNGDVGLGTTSPNELLHIYKSASANEILVESENSQDAALSLMEYTSAASGSDFGSVGNGFRVIHDGGDNKLYIQSYSSGGSIENRVAIDRTNGSVGIGTTDLDGTPAVGRATIKASADDGTSNGLVIRNSSKANVFRISDKGNVYPEGAYYLNADTTSNDHTPQYTDQMVYWNGSQGDGDIYMPAGVQGQYITYFKTDDSIYTLTLYPNGSETINGAADYTLTATQYKYVKLNFVYGTWYIVGAN